MLSGNNRSYRQAVTCIACNSKYLANVTMKQVPLLHAHRQGRHCLRDNMRFNGSVTSYSSTVFDCTDCSLRYPNSLKIGLFSSFKILYLLYPWSSFQISHRFQCTTNHSVRYRQPRNSDQMFLALVNFTLKIGRLSSENSKIGFLKKIGRVTCLYLILSLNR